MSDDVHLSADAAETLLEAGGTLADDIRSGRQWGWDNEAAKENHDRLVDALTELRDALEEADGE